MASKFAAFNKANPALTPLFVVCGAGCLLAGSYLTRMALNDAAWTRGNQYPWQRIPQTHNTHFLNVQSKPHAEVFKPQSAEDLRGKL